MPAHGPGSWLSTLTCRCWYVTMWLQNSVLAQLAVLVPPLIKGLILVIVTYGTVVPGLSLADPNVLEFHIVILSSLIM